MNHFYSTDAHAGKVAIKRIYNCAESTFLGDSSALL